MSFSINTQKNYVILRENKQLDKLLLYKKTFLYDIITSNIYIDTRIFNIIICNFV